MKISKIPGLGRFGVFIDDLDFNTISEEEWLEVGRIHLQNLVTIIRNTNLSHDHYPRYIKKFGESRFSSNQYLQKKYNKTLAELLDDALNDRGIMSDADRANMRLGINSFVPAADGLGMQRIQIGFDDKGYPLGWFADGELNWHSNEPGLLHFTPGVALFGKSKMVGSATGFLTTVDAYENFSESFRSELNEMIILHTFLPEKGMPGAQDPVTLNAIQVAACPIPESEVPLVIQSPGGLTGLHYSPASVNGIKGMKRDDAQKVFDEIDRHLFQEKYTYDHWYQQDNDLLFFDNSITMHRRLGNTEGRIGYRVPFDYTNLQDGFYQPYKNHPRYARRYITQLDETIKLAGITNFKRPTVLDYIKTFF